MCIRDSSNRDPLVVAITAALGAGVATSFAICRGQNPVTALGITIFAAIVALICDRAGLV